MKSIPGGIGGILAILSYVNFTFSIPINTPNAYMLSINRERAQLAEQFNISNMNKLIWSGALEQRARNATCPTTDQNTFRYYLKVTNPDGSTRIPLENTHFSHLHGLIVAQPLQKTVGCNFDFQCDLENSKVQGLCLVGPLNTASMDDFKRGKPGSECGMMKNEGGLCTDN